MRIIFVTPDFLTKNKPSTGLPNYLYRVSLALIRMGHVPIIVTGGERTEHVIHDGIEVYREEVFTEFCKREELNYIYNSIKGSYKLNKAVKRICKENKVDVIQYASLYGLAMFHNKKVPSVLRLSSYAKVYFKSFESYSEEYVKIMSIIERYAAKKVTGIIAPSNVMAHEFQKDVHKKVNVIETPFENDVKVMDDSILKEKIGDKKYLLFFGSLYAEKGIFVLSEIIYNILTKYQEYYFVFVGKVEKTNGKDPLKVLYQRAGNYKDRIIYIKPLKHDQLYPIIDNAELVVLPSLMENFSNACIEAMFFGKIVIGTEGTSFEQLILDGENGFLAVPNSSSSLLEKIIQCLDSSDEQKYQMGMKAKKRINMLRPEISVKRLLDYYDYIIKKHNISS